VATGLSLIWIGFAAVIYALMIAMAADRLGGWTWWLGGAGFAASIPLALEDPNRAALLLGVAVTVGCLVHDLGDALTKTGCPLLALIWPWPIQGETWYEIRLLGPLSFRTNGRVEKLLVAPLLVVLT